MSSNSNLFYKLYSNSNNTVSSGYTCKSAVDEADTSFDITSSTSGAVGTITDSNGNTLASIPFSEIHSDEISQYNSETRILQPYSCCLLQGQEYGLACASYYFLIPKCLSDTTDYEYFVDCDFDIIYNNFTPYKFHISTKADSMNSFIDLVNDELENNNVEVSVSLQQLEDPGANKTFDYLVFLAQKEGYFYYINNIKLTPSFQSEEQPESPFSKSLSGLKAIIYNFIEQFHPIKKCDYCPTDCDCGCNEYNEDNYEVDCELYKWLIYNYQNAVDNFDKFKEAVKLLLTINDDMPEWEVDTILDKVNNLIANTCYDADLFNDYDAANMSIILDIIESIKALVEEAHEYYQDMYWLIEDRCRRIPLMKYPNGAFRGIVIIPDWPTNGEGNEYKSLWVNHVKSQVKLYRHTKEGQFLPKIYGVLSNATVMSEQNEYKQHCPYFKNLTSNCEIHNNIPDGWNDTLSTSYIDPYRPEHSIYEDTVYMGQNCYAHKKNIIGLFRYMQYVNDEKLWNKVGEAYMIIGNKDNPQSQDKNLPSSLLIYNPNPEPIRIKYLIFS